MSRRKQSRPRSVKVVNEDEDFPLNPEALLDDGNEDSVGFDNNNNDSNNTDNNSSFGSISENSKIIPPSDKVQNEARPETDVADTTSRRLSSGEKRNLSGLGDGPPVWSLPVPGVSGQQVRDPVQHQLRPTPPLIPPNFLLSPSSTSVASALFQPRFLPAPPHLIPNPFTPPHPPPPPPSSSSSSSLPGRTQAFEEMARRKKAPRSIAPWRVRMPDGNHEDSNSSSNSSTISKPPRCQICPASPLDGSSPPPLPVEGHEYFIDPDGTLTIKNGVCPRSLALMLFTHVLANQNHYETSLGRNLGKFLLNLKQIVEKHQFECPTENSLQWTNAQKVLKEYAHGSALKPVLAVPPIHNFGSIHSSSPRKRPHQEDDLLRTSVTGQMLSDFFPREVTYSSGEREHEDIQTKDSGDVSSERSHIPDNFLVEPPPTPSPSPSRSPPPGHKSSQTARKDKKSPDSGMALTPSGSERDHRDGTSDTGSVGGASSRVTSPAPSISSVASSLSLAEAAKQMANTKRGSKILPIAGGDGSTRYLCPVCALELPNDHELTVHIRSHNSQNVTGQVTTPNTCTICGKTLSSQSSLDRHMLVHSGERPFRCKICDMSFTTNGNMHRHARIHEKNGSSTPKPPGRKPSASAPSSTQPSSSSNSSSKSGRVKKESGHPQPVSFPRDANVAASSSSLPPLMAEFGSDKLDLFKSQQDPSALLQYYNDMSLRMGQLMFPFGSHHPAFPYQHMVAESSRLPYLPPMPVLNPFTGEVLAKRARLSSSSSSNAMMSSATNHAPLVHLAREMTREPSPDLRAQGSVSCNLCPRTFISQWSLDSHMESHVIVDEEMEEENSCAKCKICKTVAKSEESLLLHTLTHHPSSKDLTEPDNKTSRKSPSPKSSPRQNVCPSSPSNKSASAGSGGNSSSGIKPDNSSGNSQGFQGLNFASFTSKKFPLIAKVYCEEECEGSARAIRLPVYPCSQCALEFPVEGARDLHEVSHLPEEYTACPTCKCHFSSSSQLQLHMLKHVADLHFEESRESESPHCDIMTQSHFLAQFGLVRRDVGDFPSSVLERILEIKHKQDKDINDTEIIKCENDQGEREENEQQIKQEVVKMEEDRGDGDAESDSVIANKSVENEEESPQLHIAKLSSSHRDKTTEKGKASSSSSLKISPSLFGGRASVKSVPSRSPSPLSMSEGDLGLESQEDLSMPPLFPCKHCGVVLSSPRALKYHQRSHHEAAQFRCQVCSYTSTDKSTLLRHMRTHSGERPYKCAVCDYSFTTKANCERHLRQKHGLDRDQMAGKIKCNQYIIASSSLPSSVSVDEDKTPLSPSDTAYSSPSTSTVGSTRCPTCLVDFFNYRGLQQHLQVSPRCRIGYLCLKCKVTFSSRKALISHMSSQHPSVPAQDYNRFTASLETAGRGSIDGAEGGSSNPVPSSALTTPPPAHSHIKSKPSSVSLSASSTTSLQQKQLLQNLPANVLALLPPGLIESACLESHTDKSSLSSSSSSFTPAELSGFSPTTPDCDDDQPLDFSSTGCNKLDSDTLRMTYNSAQKRKQKKKLGLASLAGTSSEDNYEDEDEAVMSPEETDGPIDLSMAGTPSQQPQQQLSSAGIKALTMAQGQTIPPNQSGQLPDFAKFAAKVEGGILPLTLGVSNASSLTPESRMSMPPTRTNPSIARQLSPYSHSAQRSGELELSQALNQKHPAFPQLLSMMKSPVGKSIQGIPTGAVTAQALQGLNLMTSGSRGNGEAALTLQQKMAALLPDNLTLHPSVFTAGNPGAASLMTTGSRSAVEVPRSKTSIAVDGSAGIKGSQRDQRQTKQPLEQGKDPGGLTPQRKVVTGKGSSSESDSSCDLASVNKILDATDAQRFQGFLKVAQGDDEQGYRSESIESGDDSNTSLENMYSKSFTSGQPLINKAKSKDIPPDTTKDVVIPPQPGDQKSDTKVISEDEEEALYDKKLIAPVTVNIALVDPIVFEKGIYKGDKLDLSCKKQTKPEVSDPNNMSEQAIAALIEKVSRENVCSPAKKKRNSYADSPHKFSCPYCSRCFPWLSSLNRHLLTHTGQKPFKCPRCPVTFSTKSNRERHLIRKHNVNMLDSASRNTIDRPFKCHLCAFSSFSAQCNLVRHYRDRHPELSPPPNLLEDAAGSDGEPDDIISYEDEEEYNSLAEQASLRGLSDRDIMLHNYTHDADLNHNSSTNNKPLVHDTHKKRNAVFSLDTTEGGASLSLAVDKLNGLTNKGDGPTGINGVLNSGNNSTPFNTSKSGASTRPGIDDTMLTDTMKHFLDKSVRQALEDSHRRAMEEGSKFVITPAIERHLRSLSDGADCMSGLDAATSASEDVKEEDTQCVICDREFPSRQMLASHMNHDHELELPYRCHVCDMAFCTRVECLQHMEHAHRVQWADFCVRNNIGNIQIFATRLDKMIRKMSKRQTWSAAGQEDGQTSPATQLGKSSQNGQSENNDGPSPSEERETPDAVQGEDSKQPDQESRDGTDDTDQKLINNKNGDVCNSDDGSDRSVDEKTGDDEDDNETGVLPEVISSDYLRRKFYCSVCPKRYWSVLDLRTHMRSHTGERPHECTICGRRFTLKNSLTRHMARHHVVDSGKVGTPAAEGLMPSHKLKHDIEEKDQAVKPARHVGAAESYSGTTNVSNGHFVKYDHNGNEEENTKEITTSSDKMTAAPKEVDTSENKSGSDEDMLHDLLGVESSTIDQIFDARDSAASLLGV